MEQREEERKRGLLPPSFELCHFSAVASPPLPTKLPTAHSYLSFTCASLAMLQLA